MNWPCNLAWQYSRNNPDLKDREVKLDGDNVVEFHKLPEMQQITLKVLRWEERDKRLVIKEAQVVV